MLFNAQSIRDLKVYTKLYTKYQVGVTIEVSEMAFRERVSRLIRLEAQLNGTKRSGCSISFPSPPLPPPRCWQRPINIKPKHFSGSLRPLLKRIMQFMSGRRLRPSVLFDTQMGAIRGDFLYIYKDEEVYDSRTRPLTLCLL